MKASVPLFRNMLKSVTVETAATIGAQIGVNLLLPDGSVGTIAQLQKLFGSTQTSGAPLNTTDDLQEGQWNLYFTNRRAQDAVGGILVNSANITLAYVGGTSITADLTDLADSGIGTSFSLITRDAKGRISGTQPVTAIDNVTIGATTPSSGAFTTLSSTADATIHGVTVGLGPGGASTNLVFGVGALASRTTAGSCTAIGTNALAANLTQNANFAIGSSALGALTTGTANVAIGAQAGGFSTSIAQSVLIGSNAGLGATATAIVSAVGIGNGAIQAGGGTQPVAIGLGALQLLTVGQGNTAIGYAAGSKQTGGSGNIYIGFSAGVTATAANANVTGTTNTYIGYNSGPGTTTQLSNSIALGNAAVCTASNQIILGNASVTDARVNGDWSVALTGRGLRVAEGTNCKQGIAVLVAGSVVVANTKVTANSRIQLTGNVDGGTPGWVRVSARTAGTSFTITSSSVLDTSTIAYEIFEPA